MAETKKDWMKEKWRPAMGWMYMMVCIFDFIIFPLMWSIAQAVVNGGQVTSQWSPLTLQGAGLFHMAMGAVLGVAAWSRGQEKLAGTDKEVSYEVQAPAAKTFVSSQGKVGPVIREPEL